jgi:hypothetical protein
MTRHLRSMLALAAVASLLVMAQAPAALAQGSPAPSSSPMSYKILQSTLTVGPNGISFDSPLVTGPGMSLSWKDGLRFTSALGKINSSLTQAGGFQVRQLQSEAAASRGMLALEAPQQQASDGLCGGSMCHVLLAPSA